jgi:hypothetical protein
VPVTDDSAKATPRGIITLATELDEVPGTSLEEYEN